MLTSPPAGLLAFPCNQFAGQAPGSSEEERQYAYKKVQAPQLGLLQRMALHARRMAAARDLTGLRLQFGTDKFPVFDKIDVNGAEADPLYKCAPLGQPVGRPAGCCAGQPARCMPLQRWRD